VNLDITAQNLEGNSSKARLREIPDICPICHRSIHPKNVGNFLLTPRGLVQAVFRCTSQKCEELFIATYTIVGGANECRLHNIAPKNPKKSEFPQTICDISPTFVDIYNQTIAAEAIGLTEIVGIGLRKALEFLIKDFAAKQKPSEGEAIKKVFLGKCIQDYIDDTNVKQCAKRAAWLGNDETHYIRKWEDKDVTDLKLLIRLTTNWIENVILTQKYADEMTETGA